MPPPASTKSNVVSILPELANQCGNPLHGRGERREVANLRSDVHAHAGSLKIFRFRNAPVQARAPRRWARRTCACAGRSKCTDACRQERRDSPASRRARSSSASRHVRRKRIEFGCTFQIEQQNAGFERGLHFRNRFANARKIQLDFAALRPTRQTRSSSPPETTSNPQPSDASNFKMLRFELALTE